MLDPASVPPDAINDSLDEGAQQEANDLVGWVSNMPDEGTELEPDEFIGWTCAAAPPSWPCLHPLPSEIFVIEEDTEPAELEISKELLPYLVMSQTPSVNSESDLVMKYSVNRDDSALYGAVIERTHNVLTREEALAHADKCRLSMIKELHRWRKHQAWERSPLTNSLNLLRSKRVLKWKQIKCEKDIKGRLVAQGFQDKQSRYF